MRKKGNIHTDTGITLVALVITIIVLLILSGVTLNILIGQNGIINKATKAKEQTNLKNITEELEIIIIQAQTEIITKKGITKPTIRELSEHIRETRNEEIEMEIIYKKTAKVEIITDEVEENETIDYAKIKYKKYIFKMNENLKLEKDQIKNESEIKTNTIIYNLQGGEGNFPEQKIEKGENIRKKEPIKEGYAFIGWNTQNDGGGKTYKAGEKFEENQDITLYAIWEATEYKIKYNAMGGNISNEYKWVKYNKEYGQLEIPTKTGYTFEGWYTKQEEGEKITSNTIFKNTEETTIYARWKINEYKITYDRNFLPNNLYKTSNQYDDYIQCATAGSWQIVTDNSVAKGKTGIFTFSSTFNDGGVYLAENLLTAGKTYTWSVYVKTSRNMQLKIGQEQGGYEFWNITTDWKRITKTYVATNNTYKAFIFYIVNGTWQKDDKIYIHSLELQEGNCLNIATDTKQYNSTLGTLDIPIRTGYTFNGWYTQPTGGTKIDATTKVYDNMVYYAHWTYNG